MAPLDFIGRIRALHEKAKKGRLTPSEKADYQQQRTELGRLLLVAQHLSHGGQTLRSALRVAQLIKVEIEALGTTDKTTTIDLASGGFAVLLPRGYTVGAAALFTLMLPSFEGAGARPLKGSAKVASSRLTGTTHRVSFSFTSLEPADREYLDMVLLDFVLRRFPTPT